VIQYGPGVIPALHAVDERVSVVSLEKASEVYLGIMKAYAGSCE
jgi:succinyl-diaminopimelate desuccinylase